MTQSVLGDTLGAGRTSVAGAIKELADAGVIEHSYARITIVDRPGLEAGACECYGVMRLGQN